jgi:CheY-like chemotaxis protein
VKPLPLSIAVLDDEARMRRSLQRLLGCHGHDVALFADGAELLSAQASARFDCILLDLHMPGLNGFDVLKALTCRSPRPPVIVLTGLDLPGNAKRTAELGACAYLVKPVEEAPLMEAIRHCIAGAEER